MRRFLPFLVLLLVMIPVSAKTPRSRNRYPDVFSVVSPQSPAAPKRKTKVDVRYDKKKDLTTVRLDVLVLWKHPVGFEELGMTVAFDYPKRIIVTPKSVSLVFSAATKDWTPFPTDNLIALVDDVRFDLGKLEGGDGDLSAYDYRLDRRRISISYEDFSRIANAKKVTVALGDRKYELSGQQLQALHDFLELMQQEGQEFK